MFDRLLDFFLSILELFYFVEIVDEYQRGLVLRLGQHHRDLGPGLHFYWPLRFERVLVTNVVPDALRLPEQRVTLLGGDTLILRAVIIYRVSDVRQHLLGVQDATTSLLDSVGGTISAAFEDRTWEEFNDAEQRKAVKRRVLDRARREAAKWGVIIDSLYFADFVRVKQNFGLFGSAERAA